MINKLENLYNYYLIRLFSNQKKKKLNKTFYSFQGKKKKTLF